MIATLAAAVTAAALSVTPAGEYRVSLAGLDSPALQVTATLAAPDGKLRMFTHAGVDHLPDRWSTFVRDLRATTDSGAALELARTGPGEWQLPAGATRVRLTYRVALDFAREKWPVGNEQSGAVLDDAVYLVTKPLFFTSSAPGPWRVTFDVPAGWTVSTPWAAEDDGGRVFVAASAQALADNSIVLGRHRQLSLAQDAFTLRVALPGRTREGGELVAPVLQQTLALALRRLFPGTEPGTYLLTVFMAGQEDAEAFVDSAAFTTPVPLGRGGVPLWANTVAHELLHRWIGARIRGDEWARWRWLTEGFTEYYANRALLASGRLDRRGYLSMMEKHVGLYLFSRATRKEADRPSLFEAGSARDRLGIYQGGWVAALCLDGAIREASGGRRTLDDVMRALYERRESGPLDASALQQALDAAAGADMKPFVERHLTGRQDLPAGQCLARLGLELHAQDYAGLAWIAEREGADAAAAARREQFLSGS